MATVGEVKARAQAEAPQCCGTQMAYQANSSPAQYQCGNCRRTVAARPVDDLADSVKRNEPLSNQGGHVTQPNSEITGIRSAVARLENIAKAHTGLANGEGFIGSLAAMEVGEADQQAAQDALEASQNAGALWAQAAAAVRAHNMPVSEAYAMSPGAGNKQAQLNE